ncbi:hypothetical protein [Rhodococcus opacus]|uniref:hypothetical protein n=1 Tax=Rhodococcus opacus TaxID=37919 RepID=UPI001651167A|nr:hypothetical protein [Rhodococcus opacus]UDH01281.1 hypothetical protein K2Z90_007751 [Rhodococcus opacus PD630]
MTQRWWRRCKAAPAAGTDRFCAHPDPRVGEGPGAAPYSLSLGCTKEPDLGRQSEVAVINGKDIALEAGGWKAPFVARA